MKLPNFSTINAIIIGDTISFSEEIPQELIEKILPELLVKVGDYKVEDIVGAKSVINNGGQVKSLSLIEGKSTSDLIRKIREI